MNDALSDMTNICHSWFFLQGGAKIFVTAIIMAGVFLEMIYSMCGCSQRQVGDVAQTVGVEDGEIWVDS